MQHPLKRQDYLTLYYIVEQAHKKYLKQSRISKQPTFNILRILSSFNQIFPTTPDRLYKLIMLITKNHNPQTLDQWTRAIQKINSPGIIKNSHSSMNLNESSIAQSRILKQKQHDHSIKTYKEELDNQIQYLQSKRSRMKFVGDFRITQPSWMADQTMEENKENNMACSNKNSLRNSQHAHLISFQPTHKDSIKQNAQKLRSMIKQPHNLSQTQKFQLPKKYQLQKKINPYHEITKIDNLSLIQDRQPTSKDESKTMYSHNTRTETNSRMYFHSKTPRDNSIIRVMALDSKDSDISMRKSEWMIAGKSGEILQYQDYNMSLEQWEELNEKAIIVSEFNTKLKAFSALLANYQAFDTDRFLKSKADIFHSCYLETKALIGFKTNMHYQQIYKQKLNKAQQFHNINLSKKTWKVLQVLKDLKIHTSKKTFEVQKLNRINYEFLLSFMFQEKSLSQNSPKKYPTSNNNNSSFDFERKVQYFSKTHNFENVWNIYKYFGLNVCISKEQLTQFFKNYHQCLQKTIFSLLKKNVQKRKQRYLEMHDKRLVEKTFSILLGRKQVAKEYRENEYRAQCYANKKLKQKAYKILLSIVYSTKIFSKRQQFIEAQKAQRTKLKVLKKWLTECRVVQNKKRAISQKLESFVGSITKYLRKVSFRSIRQDSIQIQEQINSSKKQWQYRTMRKVLRHFLTLLQNKKKYINLCESNQIEFQKKILAKWSKVAKVSDGLRKIEVSYNKIVFRKMFVPLVKTVVKDYLMGQEEEKNLVKECFDSLKMNLDQNQSRRNQCVDTTTNLLQKNYMNEFLQSLKLNRLQKIHQRNAQEIQNKSQLLTNFLHQSSCQKVYIQLKSEHFTRIKDHENISKFKNLAKQQSLNLLMKNTLQDINLKQNSQKLAQCLKLKQFENVCFELKRNQTQNRQIALKLKTQKKILFRFTQSVSEKHQHMLKLKQKAKDHFSKTIQTRVLYSLAQNFIQISNKINSLEEVLEKSRKKEYLREFVTKTRKQLNVRENSENLMKIQPFSCLRQNSGLKRRERTIRENLKSSKIQQTIENLVLHKQITQQKNHIKTLSSKLHHRLFWMRFNNYFISSLLNKKHIFMAYKFRALKLYDATFSSWKQVVAVTKQRQNKDLHKKMNQNKRQRQQSLNIRNKDLTHMYKPTDCQ